MTQYLLTFRKKDVGTAILNYDDHGLLRKVDTDIKTVQALNFLWGNLPKNKANIDNLHKWCIIRQMKRDLTFKAFWNEFGNKVGNKKRAEKLWNSLNEIDKAKALDYISLYRQFLLANPGVQALYPETYLNQRRYDNE